MKRFFFLILSVLLSTMATWAKTLVTDPATQMVDGTYITMQCMDTNGGDGWYFNGATTKAETFSHDVFYKIVSDGNGAFYLQNTTTSKYVGNSNNLVSMVDDQTSAVAFTFSIATATNWTTVSADNLAKNGVSTVRFTTGSTFLNTNNSGATPKYFTGTGGYSIWDVYTYTEEELTGWPVTYTVNNKSTCDNVKFWAQTPSGGTPTVNSGDLVPEGSWVKVEATCDNGDDITVTVNGEAVTLDDSGIYTLKGLTAAADFVVTFKEAEVVPYPTPSKEDAIFTIACMSDIHSQQGMISASNVDDVYLRKAFTTSLEKIKQNEKVDAIVLGGDYTSDVTISETNWKRVRELMANATAAAFPDGAKRTPIIYTVGNHDYEVANFDNLPKNYVAGDYYSYPMKGQTGYLAPEECFYETAENGTSNPVKLLAAYHYQIGGYDFVVQNCGKYFFKSAWDYQDSEESSQWVADKLNEIDPDGTKTIFFINHLPLPASVGATSNKCLTDNTAASILTKGLAKHPGVVYLYGHDHSSSSNMSYITDDVSQRVTHYDTNGNQISNDDEEEEEEEESSTVEKVFIKSYADGTYLNYDATNNLHTSTSAQAATVGTGNISGTLSLNLGGYVHCGSSGRFSGNSSLSNNSSLIVYEINTETGVGTQVQSVEYGKTYAFCTQTTSSGNAYYLLSNVYNSTSARMVGVAASGHSATETISNQKCWWTLESTSAAKGTPSFYSCFMGSMRYNNLDTNSSPGTSDSPIIQALIVRVYNDSIVFDMQNYGQTGKLTGSSVSPTIGDPLKYFRIARTTKGAADLTWTVAVEGSDEGTVTFDGKEYKNGETFTTNYTISDEELTIKTVGSLYTTTTIENNTIKVVYSTEKPAVTYTVSCNNDNGGVIYKETTYKNGESFSTNEDVTAADLTAVELEGYKAQVTLVDNAVTVKYTKVLFVEGKAYNVSLKTAIGTYGSYLNLSNTVGSNALRSETAEEIYFQMQDDGTYYINSKADMSGNFLSASGWNAVISSTGFGWTVAETTSGYTFYQSAATYTGYLGTDSDKNKWYDNKSVTYFNVDLVPETLSFTVSVDVDGGGVVYDGKEYKNGETLTLPDEDAKANVTAVEVAGYESGEIKFSGDKVYVTYYDKTMFEEGVPYTLAEKNLPSGDECGKYVDINTTTTYKTYTDLITRAEKPVDLYFEYAGKGQWKMKSSNDENAKYMCFNSATYYVVLGTENVISWTITSTDNGYTLYQSSLAADPGYMGVDASKNRMYLDKTADNSTIYFDIVKSKTTGINGLKGLNGLNGLNGKYLNNGRITIVKDQKQYSVGGNRIK